MHVSAGNGNGSHKLAKIRFELVPRHWRPSPLQMAAKRGCSRLGESVDQQGEANTSRAICMTGSVDQLLGAWAASKRNMKEKEQNWSTSISQQAAALMLHFGSKLQF